jgi:hypothetical protein
MKLERVIDILEKHQEWRRDKNVPPKTEMQSPIEIGTAIDYALSELKKKLLADVSGLVCPDCLMGRDEFEPNWECPECRRKTER